MASEAEDVVALVPDRVVEADMGVDADVDREVDEVVLLVSSVPQDASVIPDACTAGTSLPDISNLSLGPMKVGVDGNPLVMATAKSMPSDNPGPGNLVDPKLFHNVLQGINVHASQAEFPLRKAFSMQSNTVYTNHFAIKLDPKMPLYEYEIKDLPENISKKTSRILVQNMIDATVFLKGHQDEFATDNKERIISWVEFPEEALGPIAVLSKEGKEPISLWLQNKGKVDTDRLKQYSEGKVQPNKVYITLYFARQRSLKDTDRTPALPYS